MRHRHPEHITFESFNPAKNKADLAGLVTCFQDVFADAPWNEWRRCAVCEKKWGVAEQSELAALSFTHCGQPVKEFWPADVVTADITHEITEHTSCWIARNGQTIIGFTWGYPIELDAFEQKMQLPGAAEILYNLFGKDAKFAYQDEIGVLARYRNKGIAKTLFTQRLQDFRSQGMDVGIVRTKTLPPSVTNLWFTRLGYEVTQNYNDSDGRVIMARSLVGL